MKRVEVITYAGTVVKTIDNPDTAIDLSSLAKGNYTLKVVLEGDAAQTVKIVKK